MLPKSIQIPNTFNYKIKEATDDHCVTLYAGIKSLQECDRWILEYSKLNSTKWIVRGSAPSLKRLVCSKKYVCHRSSFKKKNADKKISKNCECEAKITIVVKLTTRDTEKKHRHVREGLPAVITINNKHTHSIDTADALSALPASLETRQLFESYFENGMSITESINYHLHKLESDPNENGLTNGSINPKYRTVRHWFDKWRSAKSSSRSETGTLETFSDWRSLAKQRFNRLQQNTTNERPLNDLERELISLTAKTDKQIATTTMDITEFGFGSPPDSQSFDGVERVLEITELPSLMPIAISNISPLSLNPGIPPLAPFHTEMDPLDIKCEAEDPEVQTMSQPPPEIAQQVTEDVRINEKRRIYRKRKMKRVDVTTGMNDTYLRSIAESLKKISKIKKKNYKLRKLKLRLEHPDVNIISLSSSDSE